MTGLPPFESVIEGYGPALLRFCAARAGAGQGEDVFQEAMIAALRAYPTLRDPEAIRPWLYSIAARKAIDVHRAVARAPVPVDDLEPLEQGVAEAPAFDREIWSLVKELPNKQREAIGLRFLGELTHGEIAAAMGTSEEAARRSVFEGLKRLRQDHGEDLTILADPAS
jgi:RNA polymerase sigma factor (sigma-70 family)